MTDRHLKKVAEKPKLGKKILNFLITDTNRRKLSQYLKDRARTKMIRQVSRDGEFHLEDILNACLNHISPITAPLALISQVPFSGGSLLNRLFDGHPEIHALPHELTPARPEGGLWPEIDLGNRPEDWFEVPFKELDSASIQQRIKHGEKRNALAPFMFLPLVQKQIFLKYLKSIESIKRRDVFDAWMTACFGAWLNYQNQRHNKKFVTALAPGLAMQSENVENFFEIYPEGRFIALVREPAQWFDAVSRHEPKNYGDAESAFSHWKAIVRAAIQIQKKFGDRVLLIKFEDIATQTESVMRFLSEFLTIPYEDILLKPTFNGIAIQPVNGQKTGNDDARDHNFIGYKKWDKEKRKLIKELTDADYQTALREVVAL